MVLGCPSARPPVTKPIRSVERDDPLAEIREAVRKNHHVESCKTIVTQLNVLLELQGAQKPALPTPAERDLLTKQLRLNDEQLNEVSRQDFSLLDAHYLEECFFFHDAILSLELDFAKTT